MSFRSPSHQKPVYQVGNSGRKDKAPLNEKKKKSLSKKSVKGMNKNSDVDYDLESEAMKKKLKELELITHTRSVKFSDVNLKKLDFGFKDEPMRVEDKKYIIKLFTRDINAIASVEIPPIPEGASVLVGWIQVITGFNAVGTYGNEGSLNWDFPELKSNQFTMICDSDGKNLPWYQHDTVFIVQGPTYQTTSLNIKLFDKPMSTWLLRIPVPGYSDGPCLSNIYYTQRFSLNLVMKDLKRKQLEIIKSITWGHEMSVDVDPTKPIGSRTNFLGPCRQEETFAVLDAPPFDMTCLTYAAANDCQTLFWRATNADPLVVKLPILTGMHLKNYVTAARGHTRWNAKKNRNKFLQKQKKIVENELINK